MDTIHTCQNKVNKFWKDNPDTKFGCLLTEQKIDEMVYRHSGANPNMKGMSWLPQSGDEGIGYRHTKRKAVELPQEDRPQ